MIAFEYSELDKNIPIKNNYYIPKELYRDESGLNLLKQYGIEIIQIKDDYEC